VEPTLNIIESVVLHHTVREDATVESLRHYHMTQRGWNDIAYHWIIGNGHGIDDGQLVKGRPSNIAGAGVYGRNQNRLQIALVGNFCEHLPTRKQLSVLGTFLLVHCRHLPVNGHNEIALPDHPTVCPGTLFPVSIVRDWLYSSQASLDQFFYDSTQPHANGQSI